MMKALSSGVTGCLALVACAAAQNAYLYNLDIEPRTASSSHSSSIDSETANAILARRLGATASRNLGTTNEQRLEQLNYYGGHQTLSFFSQESTSSKPDRLVVVLEGYEGIHQGL
jgi:hypothetical protein